MMLLAQPNNIGLDFFKLLQLPLGNCRFTLGASLKPNMNWPNKREAAPNIHKDFPIPDFVLRRLLNIRRQVTLHIAHPFRPDTTERFDIGRDALEFCKQVPGLTQVNKRGFRLTTDSLRRAEPETSRAGSAA